MNKSTLEDAGLSPQQAEIVLLSEDLTVREIAHRLDVDKGTVETQIARINAKSRRAMLLLDVLPDRFTPDAGR